MREKYIVFILGMVLLTIAFFMLASSVIDGNESKINQLDKKIKTAQEKLNSARIMDEQLSQFSLIIDNIMSREKSFSFDEINEIKKKSTAPVPSACGARKRTT